MQCNICFGSVKSFLGFPSHLKHKHSLGTRDYYDRFFASGSDSFCVVCSGSTQFLDLSRGYREFCSHECADGSHLVRERRKQTTVERYGVENVFQSDEKKAKSKQTLLERYGVDHQMRSPEVLERVKATNVERYGVEWQITSSGTRAAIIETFDQRYGCDNPFGNVEV